MDKGKTPASSGSSNDDRGVGASGSSNANRSPFVDPQPQPASRPDLGFLSEERQAIWRQAAQRFRESNVGIEEREAAVVGASGGPTLGVGGGPSTHRDPSSPWLLESRTGNIDPMSFSYRPPAASSSILSSARNVTATGNNFVTNYFVQGPSSDSMDPYRALYPPATASSSLPGTHQYRDYPMDSIQSPHNADNGANPATVNHERLTFQNIVRPISSSQTTTPEPLRQSSVPFSSIPPSERGVIPTADRSATSDHEPQDDQGLQTQKSFDIYYRHLSVKQRGFPLWIPEPNCYLPIEYQRKGINIGDVGVITAAGGFDYLFNVLLAHDHPFNVGRVPPGFAPLDPPLDLKVDVRGQREYKSNSVIASSSVKQTFGTSDNVGTTFHISASEGAILTIPDGALSEDLGNLDRLRRYTDENLKGWYLYANGPRGRELRNGDLRLVLGCDKATAWGMATFANLSQDEVTHLRFKPVATPHFQTYGWELNSGTAEVRSGPDASEVRALHEGDAEPRPFENQCIFVRTTNPLLADAVWQKMMAELRVPSGSGGTTETKGDVLPSEPAPEDKGTTDGQDSSNRGVSACAACRVRRDRCDLDELSVGHVGPTLTCSNCKEWDLKCVLTDESFDIRAAKLPFQTVLGNDTLISSGGTATSEIGVPSVRRNISTDWPQSLHRPYLSCTACRIRKTRCNSKFVPTGFYDHFPPCSNCQRRRTVCVLDTYTPPALRPLWEPRRKQVAASSDSNIIFQQARHTNLLTGPIFPDAPISTQNKSHLRSFHPTDPLTQALISLNDEVEGPIRIHIPKVPAYLTSHPSKALNEALLQRYPDAKVAITDDSDWSAVLTEDDIVMPKPGPLTERILSAATPVVNAAGFVYLEKKSSVIPNLMLPEVDAPRTF